VTEFPAVYPERDPESFDNDRTSAVWKDCIVTFETDDPDDCDLWEIDFLDRQGVAHSLPLGLSEFLVEEHYEEILQRILDEVVP